MSHGKDDQEEQFILRVEDPILTRKLQKWLRETESLSEKAELVFEAPGGSGHLIVEGVQYPVCLQDLPTMVEAYKTYDDSNLIKTGDVGQLLLVRSPSASDVPPRESPDGVTPPMKDARTRHFRKFPPLDPQVVSQVEKELLTILSGKAPEGWQFHDIEEEWVVDEETGRGSWQPVAPR